MKISYKITSIRLWSWIHATMKVPIFIFSCKWCDVASSYLMNKQATMFDGNVPWIGKNSIPIKINIQSLDNIEYITLKSMTKKKWVNRRFRKTKIGRGK